MQIKTQGLIIKQRNIGENDRIVTILSPDLGIIEASARGSKSTKSTIAGAVQILGYSDFCLYKSKGKSTYIVNSAESISSFYSLRLDVVKLSLAGYFCELINHLSGASDENAGMFLKLILNCFYFLEQDKISCGQLKSIFEIRAMSIGGFMPNLVCCVDCMEYIKPEMKFLPVEGIIICSECLLKSQYNNEKVVKFSLNGDVLAAFRHVVFSEFNKIFSFRIGETSLKLLNYITENYVLMHIEKSFNSLEMYNSISQINMEKYI